MAQLNSLAALRKCRARANNENIGGRWRRRGAYLAWSVAGLLFLQPASAAVAFPTPATVDLATASAFTVLAATTVTNTGATVISADAGVGGNLGVSSGSAVTGFTGPPDGVVTPPGTIHAGDAMAGTAQTDAGTASVSAAGRSPDQVFDPIYDLAGQTFTAGVYKAPTSLAIGGVGATVTLDGQTNPDAVFIFQIGSTLVTGASSTVELINGAQACNVFWQVGSSATLGANSTFNGTILAAADASLGSGVNVQGRVFAGTGAVTLINDAINTPACAPSTGVSAAPLLGAESWIVIVAAFLGGVAVLLVRRSRRPAHIS